MPPSSLAVDDDPLCLRAVMFALQKAEMTPDTAETGEKAVELAAEKSYDVVFMDIKMPGIDGLRACEQIHELKKNENTPVVFVIPTPQFRWLWTKLTLPRQRKASSCRRFPKRSKSP